ncbi:MAG: glycosyltransferase [Chlorobium sp.]
MSVISLPLVSVIIPTYNHAQFLGRALQSVMEQTYTNWEAIVVDNHSKDNTDDVVNGFKDPRIRLLKIYNNGVIAASRNMGINGARGEWVAFLDSDDWWSANKLQKCLENINSEVDLIYHELKIIRDSPALFRRKTIKSWQVKKPVLIDLLVRGNAIATSSVVIRKKLLDRIEGMDENINLVASEDYNTWLRIARLTNGFKYFPEIMGFYLLHDQGISRKDMSGSVRQAVSEFISILNEKQKKKVESFIKYSSGRFHFVNGDFYLAKKDLLFSLKYGSLQIKVKSIVMLILPDKLF